MGLDTFRQFEVLNRNNVIAKNHGVDDEVGDVTAGTALYLFNKACIQRTSDWFKKKKIFRLIAFFLHSPAFNDSD